MKDLFKKLFSDIKVALRATLQAMVSDGVATKIAIAMLKILAKSTKNDMDDKFVALLEAKLKG